MFDQKDLKADLMAQVEASIEQLLAAQPPSDKITLNDMERLVSKAGSEIEAQVMQSLVERNEAAERSERAVCAECQQPMRHKGSQRRKVVTKSGEIEVNRPYYYCEQCQVGVFPPG
ncbi:MAG: hypothetical protein GY767_11005 [Shimia sp.]|nr:hypothetical protein [Shimia sp.]